MGFKVTNEEHSIVKFHFDSDFTKQDLSKFLGILSRLLDISEENNKPFGFYIDAREASVPPLNAGKHLISWMSKERPRIEEKMMLRASSVCITSQSITNMINWCFTVQPTVSPNILTKDIGEAQKFVKDIMERS